MGALLIFSISIPILFCGKTRTFNSLYQISLQEDINDNERKNDHDTTSVLDSRFIQVLARIVCIKRNRDSNDL